MAPQSATALPLAPFCSCSVRWDQDEMGVSAYTKHITLGMSKRAGAAPRRAGTPWAGCRTPHAQAAWAWALECTTDLHMHGASTRVCISNLVCRSPPPAQARLPHTTLIPDKTCKATALLCL